MSGKKRWWIAIISSLIINAFLLLIASYQIIQQKPLEKLPEEPQLTEVFMDDDSTAPEDEPSTGRGETQVVANDENDIALPTNKQEKDADNQTEGSPSDNQNQNQNDNGSDNGSNGGNKKDRPKRYNLSGAVSTKNINLADITQPILVSEQDSFQIPANTFSATDQIPSVEITYRILASGEVQADVTKSSGNDDFDDEALRTIYTWKYAPMKQDFPGVRRAIFMHQADSNVIFLRKGTK